MSDLKAGDRAPDFALPDADGNTVKLSDFAGKAVVLYFYPKDNTPGCTREACSFRDSYEDFVAAGATVIGVSNDDGESHKGFASQYKLPFTLLSDRGGKVAAAYGVKASLFGLLAGRVTFVIDKGGVIRHSFNSQLRFNQHVTESLEVVKSLR